VYGVPKLHRLTIIDKLWTLPVSVFSLTPGSAPQTTVYAMAEKVCGNFLAAYDKE
jgi:hypothetical protein